ncbi:MFS general substrate transporter [Auriscalpium vulgare]|uniref:MFS general substrate transporter n=1 Tax=Auriscalpium vulgare TaxID=40419 RepID=A0ACB8RYY5_9AGAM|nr:MFS general substrate transporter [Auriscalpium vulgare]
MLSETDEVQQPLLCASSDSAQAARFVPHPRHVLLRSSFRVDGDTLKKLVTIIIPCGTGILLAALDKTSITSAYASIGSDLGQLQNAGWIATGYMLTQTSFQPLYGKLSDIFGRKASLLFAYAVYSAGCLLCSLSSNMAQLVVGRAVAGLGGGGMTTLPSIIVTDSVPLRTRGSWQGVLNTIFAAGALIGAPLGGALTDGSGWRWIFRLQLSLAVVAAITVSTMLRLPAKADAGTTTFSAKMKRVDFLGAVLLVLTILTLLLGLNRGGNIAWFDRWTITCLFLASSFGVLLAFVEAGVASEPFAPAGVVVKRTLIPPFFCNFFTTGADACLFFYVPMYYQAVANKSASQVGAVLMPVVLSPIVGSFGAGLLIQSTARYLHLARIAFGLQLLGAAVVLAFATQSETILGVSTGDWFSVLRPGIGVTSTLVALVANAGPADQAVATAISYLSRSMGGVIGISMGGTLIQNTLRKLLHARFVHHDLDVEEIIRQVRASLTYIDQLEPVVRDVVRSSYHEALRSAFLFSISFSCCAFVAAWFIHQVNLSEIVITASDEGDDA